MDNVTHTLTAIALSNAGLNRKTRFATAALVLGSNLPDIDIVWSFQGTASYLKFHRGITHSFLGITVLAALLFMALYYWGHKTLPKETGPPLNAKWLLAICCMATATHLLMDFTNAYGVRPLLPFSGRWFAWSIMPIVDIILLALLLAAWILPALFRLVSEEVGATKPGFRWEAVAVLVCTLLLWGLRDSAHRRVLGQLDAHDYRHEDPLHLDAFPTVLNPFEWTGVVETESAFYLLPANALEDDVRVERAQLLHKPSPSPALEAAKNTSTGKIFYDFARFPWAQVTEKDQGFEVSVHDLRFASPDSRRTGFEMRIRFDENLHVISEAFHF